MRTTRDERPLTLVITDEDPRRLRTRARAACDDCWAHWSRSYSGALALVAGWHLRVGVDVERRDLPMETTWSFDDEVFRSTMMTSAERTSSLAHNDVSVQRGATSLWCSKEALAKALGTPRQLDPARLEGPALWGKCARGVWRADYLDAGDLGHDALAWVVHESSRRVDTE